MSLHPNHIHAIYRTLWHMNERHDRRGVIGKPANDNGKNGFHDGGQYA